MTEVQKSIPILPSKTPSSSCQNNITINGNSKLPDVEKLYESDSYLCNYDHEIRRRFGEFYKTLKDIENSEGKFEILFFVNFAFYIDFSL